MADANVRVRFAPSPTGDPHIGSIWTAQFNWLFARQHGGKFILRIEDTDQKRLVPGSAQKIYEALNWYGLDPDEGPQQGGEYGPYVQSQRLDTYKKYAQQLVEQGLAYYCFCSTVRLEKLRQEQTAAKQPPRYDKLCAAIAPAEAISRVTAGQTAVIRLNVPTVGTIELIDIIRGRVSFRFDQLDDSVLLKSDGWPTYHLANVVDDHLMAISHVIRAEEWLPSAPKHLLLYQGFGWSPPQFAHLPLLLGSDKSKLSKRHGATAALMFRDEGYLPEALQNFLALMGWHPKGDKEVLTRQEIIEQFRLDQVNPSGAIFDRTKLDWLNGYYLRQMPIDDLLDQLKYFWHIPTGEKPNHDWRRQAIRLVQDRLKKMSEIDEASNFLFPSVWNMEVASFAVGLLIPRKSTMEVVKQDLTWAGTWLAQDHQWSADSLKEKTMAAIAQSGKKNGSVLWPVRVALSLRAASPDVFDLLAILGQAESLRRIRSFSD